MKKIRIGVLISGTGSNMKAIIDACKSGKINGEVVFVGSDNPEAKGLAWAKEQEIPTFVVDYKEIFQGLNQKSKHDLSSIKLPPEIDFETLFIKSKGILPSNIATIDAYLWLMKRIAAEMEMLRHMDNYEHDLIVLAGFMRNLIPYFIDQVNSDPENPRIMNIHPALLPAFPGTDGYGDTMSYGCKVGGCTVHFIDYREDIGPIIGQRTFPIFSHDTLEDIKEGGLKEEWQLFPECIQLFAQGRLKVVENEKGRKVIEILEGGRW